MEMKYFNINVTEEEVDRKPDIVRLCAIDKDEQLKCIEFVNKCWLLDDDSTTRNDILAKRFNIPYERKDYEIEKRLYG